MSDPPWVTVYRDTVELPSGRVLNGFHHLTMPEFAVVVPFTERGDIVMVREYKHGIGRVVLNVPAGSIEVGESPLEAAQRELLEESGHTASAWRSLGRFVVDGSAGCGTAHLFVARGATRVGPPALDDTEEVEVEVLPPERVREALANGEISLLPTACAVAMALLER